MVYIQYNPLLVLIHHIWPIKNNIVYFHGFNTIKHILLQLLLLVLILLLLLLPLVLLQLLLLLLLPGMKFIL